MIEDSLGDAKSPKGSGINTPVRSRVTGPVVSNSATPMGSGAEGGATAANPVAVKKKMTRNQLKTWEVRRNWRGLPVWGTEVGGY